MENTCDHNTSEMVTEGLEVHGYHPLQSNIELN